MTVRNVKKNLAGQQDLLPGVGPYSQSRRGVAVSMDGPAKSYIELWKSYCGDAYVGTFEDGFTATTGNVAVSLVLGRAYRYTGTTQVIVAKNSSPDISWSELVVSTDSLLAREALRRSYAEAGYNLVAGSFEAGGTLVNVNDVLLQESTGKAFSGPAGGVSSGTNPASGGFTEVTSVYSKFNAADYGLNEANTGLQNCKALQALAAAVQAEGGGHVTFPYGSYTIGAQTLAGVTGKGYSYLAEMGFSVSGLTKDLVLNFEGSKFKWADGLRFGSFDPVTGNPRATTSPYYVLDSAAGIGTAFEVKDSKAVIILGSVKIDGNGPNMVIGGKWGDKGYQLGHSGFRLMRNESVVNEAYVDTRNHLLDGYYCGCLQVPNGFTTLSNIYSLYNGRQGLSITGGNNITINSSVLGMTSDGAIINSPGFGVDIETEIAPIDGITFNTCYFPVGQGGGVVSDNFSVRNATFNDCIFEGSIGRLLYLRLSGCKFNNCKFYGQLFPVTAGTHAYQSGGLPVFTNCHFSNMKRDGITKASGWPRSMIEVSAIFRNCTALVYHESAAHVTAFAIDGSEVFGFNVDITGTLPSSGAWMLIRGLNHNIKDLLINNKTTSGSDTTNAAFIEVGTPSVENCHLGADASGHKSLRWGTPANYPNSIGLLMNGSWDLSTAPNLQNTIPREMFLSLSTNMSALDDKQTLLCSCTTIGVTGQFYPRGAVIYMQPLSVGAVASYGCTVSGLAGSTAVFKPLNTVGA